MRSFFARGLLLALSAVFIPSAARAQYTGYGAPSMLASQPQYAAPTAQPTAFRGYQNTAGYGGYAAGYGGYSAPNYYMVSQPGAEEVPSPSDQHSIPGPAAAPQMMPQAVPQQHYHAPAPAPYAAPAPMYGGNCASGNCGGYSGAYAPTYFDSYGGSCGYPASGPSCYVPSYGPACGNWFGGVGGLIMTRDHSNNRWLSYDSAYPSEHLLTTNDADMPYAGGFETRVGRYFNCGWNAVEVVYWGLFPGASQAAVSEASLGGGNLGTTMTYDSLYIDNGAGNVLASSYFNDAAYHRIRMDNEFHNIEMNVLGYGVGGFGGGCGGGWGGRCGSSCGAGGCGAGACGYGSCGSACNSCCNWGPAGPGFCCNGCNRWRMNWTAGVRYFRFNERFEYASDYANTAFTYDNPDEVFHHINVTNNLVGFQLGGRMEYCLGSCFSAYGGTKMGVYGNHISQRQCLYNSEGAAVITQPASPYNGLAYDISSSKTDVSFLGELDLGVTYRFKSCWSVSAGYRVVALTGVALTTNQFPVYYSDLADVRDIDSNGSLILHGLYAGVNYNW